MERGAGLSRYHHPKPTSGLNWNHQPENPNANPTREPTGQDPNPNHAGENDNMVPPQICMVREQDQYMPIANVIRIMRRILPAHAKISDDAKETIQECVSEYISFVTGEANERCQREQRKTITAEDVLWAMGKLGFDDYVEPLTIFLTRYRECETDRGSSLRGESQYKSGGFHGTMAAQQVTAPPYGYGVFDPSVMMGGYYQNGAGQGGGGASSSSSMGGGMPSAYDPYGHQYK
ncbi:PREDICTED: nuclear transcription factor Y subunit B-9 [Tarenaya hassleriana]|uniref:nuclear transcription factor Y subunit B-9 n=1 Tax=Tarenaya hassleriana TaxID=28532 RepID=UPI00053C751A|nr:PREDICTED: nuclear transcription factor Y subunit B-9 [Tarenaya hassleriana]